MTNLKIEEQRKEIRKLKLENGNLLRRLKHSKISTKGKKKEANVDDDQRVSLHARKFCVMNEIFVPESAFLIADPKFDPMDSDRYTSEDFIRKGVIAELFEEVPMNLHTRMQETGSFRDVVSCCHLNLSSVLNQIKSVCLDA